jgi:ABC-type transporter Mla subunit MlaD
MLTLTVRVGQSVKIGDVATVKVEEKSGQAVRLTFDADRSVPIRRIPDAPRREDATYGLTGTPGPAGGGLTPTK